ncbi:MAG: hypothetical protein GY788_32370 [bacterium]|nr:hypothetical protein [bacterium]
MADITITNEQDTIIDEIIATLEAGTVPTAVAIFDFVEKTNSVDWYKSARLGGIKTAALAGVVNETTEEFKITDLRLGCILHLKILLASQKVTDELRVTEINKLIDACKILINADKPSTSICFYQDGEETMTQRVVWGEPEIDSETKTPWVFAELPVEIAYVTTNEESH